MAEEITAKAVQLENPDADYETLKKEMDAKAKAKADDFNIELSAEEVVLRTQFLNLAKQKIHRIERHFWTGSAISDIAYLHNGTYVYLHQKGTKPEGVKWGQVWATGAADDTTARKWVVAFDSASGKAYAEAGPMGPVDWNVIEVKLGMSGSKTEHTDPILGGNVLATIDGLLAYAHFR